MNDLCLITGGAGFIGSHLADELLSRGYRVRVLDNLDPQVHGNSGRPPRYLSREVEFVHGDVTDPAVVRRALRDADQVVHFAAKVGVGQSMYDMVQYTQVNNLGTAVLLEALIEQPVSKLLVASSMSIYGEGLYTDAAGRPYGGVGRSAGQLHRGQWEVLNAEGEPLHPLPTPESKQPALASVYALGKYDQERLCLMTGAAYKMPTTAMRFFNVYGPRQALSNPYTGVLAIFASRYLNDNPPLIYEDGQQKRDFVSVYDVARACRLALESDRADGQVYNIGSGQSYTVYDIARTIQHALNKEYLAPEVTGKYRVGDIRHCFADISKARAELGFEPEVTLEDGIAELARWLEGQTAHDAVEAANAELARRGLTI